MSLAPGTRLGPYEITALIGVGGMGEVYRARDTKLQRDVAIKVLPEVLAHDSERLARFEREARTLASLNHPNIGQIHGLEESDGIKAIVMELVEGPTLADRIAQGPIPVDDALPIAKQIAEALEAAHEQGIVHRDLKPANVKVRPDGIVKVLDFGLAKALEPVSAGSPDATTSPTITSPAMMTRMGVILGTAAYMSPEQAKGRAADKRSDLWAFGCVLYEMLTGRRAFEGEDVSETLATVLKGEPDWTALPGEVSPRTVTLIRRCVQKDTKKRTRDAGDIVVELEEALSAPATPAPATATGAPILSRRSLVVGLAGLLLGGFITGLAVWRQKPAPTLPVSRFPMALPPGQRLAGLNLTAIAFSPDGSRLVYVASATGPQQLYMKEMDSLEAMPIAGTEGAAGPFFSPDGQNVGFFTSDWLKKVSIRGGPPEPLAPVEQFGRGGSWGTDGTIVFAHGSNSGLSLVSETGGTAKPLTMVDREKGEGSHRLPHHLPGGKAVLFTVGTGASWDDAQIEVVQLDTGKRTKLIEGGSDGRYVPTRHLVFLRAGFLMSVPFDLIRLAVTGSANALVQGLLPSTPGNTGAAQATLADSGSLVFVSGGGRPGEKTLTWVDRKGTEQPLQLPPRAFQHPRLSPDGQRVVFNIDEGNKSDVWIYDLRRGSLDKLTSEGASFPIWTSNGEKVTFVSTKTGPSALFWKTADIRGTEELLAPSGRVPGSWSPNGETLAFSDRDPTTGLDIWTLSLKDGRKPQPFVRTPSHERNPAFSPDGRWVAYQSNKSGLEEVYLEEFPGPGKVVLVSSQGGGEPVWSRDGHELFYRSGAKMMAVANPFERAKPEVLFERPYARNSPRDFDVTSDGRFLMLKESEQDAAAIQINVVLNWTEELKRRVPTK